MLGWIIIFLPWMWMVAYVVAKQKQCKMSSFFSGAPANPFSSKHDSVYYSYVRMINDDLGTTQWQHVVIDIIIRHS